MTAFTDEVVDGLKSFLHDVFVAQGLPDDTEVTLYLFDDDSRISEVGYVVRRPESTGGGAWMRSDPDALDVICACEDFLLCFGHEPEWHERSRPDDLQVYDPDNEARWKLAFLMSDPTEAFADRDAFAARFQIERVHP
jgi:hypothetical protein